MYCIIILIFLWFLVVGVVNEVIWKEFVLESKILVLVDFWVLWCGFCCMIVLFIDELVKIYVG